MKHNEPFEDDGRTVADMSGIEHDSIWLPRRRKHVFIIDSERHPFCPPITFIIPSAAALVKLSFLQKGGDAQRTRIAFSPLFCRFLFQNQNGAKRCNRRAAENKQRK